MPPCTLPAGAPRADCTPLPLQLGPLQDVGGCGVRHSVTYRLTRLPRVFTLQLAWESHSELPERIAATLAAVDEQARGARGHCGAAVERRIVSLQAPC